MRLFTGIAVAIVFAACTSGSKPELKTGTWRGVLDIQGHDLPFTFDILRDSAGGYDAVIHNAGEKLLLDEIRFEGDTAVVVMHIFDAELRIAAHDDSLHGVFVKNFAENYRVPFRAAYNQNHRFAGREASASRDFSGKYSVVFTNDSDTTQAVGIVSQQGNHAEGTFLTPTGDYRFLEGSVIGDSLYLSTFDGNYAYLFSAAFSGDSTLSGNYWSGLTWHQQWTARRDDDAELPDAESLTFLKDGYNTVAFSFPDVNGTTINFPDARYKDKVVILQLTGSWCPNCMDETRFLAPWYKKNKDRGVEIIGLAFERKPEFDYASARVKKMIGKLSVPYPIVIAGTNDKENASRALPMLTSVMAFPTTIFIGRDGQVKKIHTGFSGPGTGVYYEQFVADFNATINELLKDKTAFNQ